jgi:hypothetical protein
VQHNWPGRSACQQISGEVTWGLTMLALVSLPIATAQSPALTAMALPVLLDATCRFSPNAETDWPPRGDHPSGWG